MRIATAGLVCLFAASFACKDDSTPSTKSEVNASKDGETTGTGFSGRHRDNPKSGWIPAEFQSGMACFKDPGVYVDGVLAGIITFGELPIGLKPTWKEEEASVEFGPQHKGPKVKIVRERRYKFVDYFRAVGIDVEKIKEVHLYGGGKRAASTVFSGKEVRESRNFMFRFGGDVWGKPIPSCDAGIGDGKCPDNLTAVTVYIERKPPIREEGYFVLDGKRVRDIPYYGEPLRGGVRVYLDDRLMTAIKRRKLLDESLAVSSPDGELNWKLFGFLKSQGVDTSKVSEAWIIHNERRVKRLSREDLVGATFLASPQRSGEILFGDTKIPTNALALHTQSVSKDKLPVILPHEG